MTTEHAGKIPMSELSTGDSVLSLKSDGTLGYSEVLTFLDRSENRVGKFYNIHTSDQRQITLTDKHMIYVSQTNSSAISNYKPIFAEKVQLNNFVLLSDNNINIRISQIVQITTHTTSGVYAPLTFEGTIVVDDIVASCYGVIDNEFIAHASFAPMRALRLLSQYTSLFSWTRTVPEPTGVHWYADMLYGIGQLVFSPDTLYTV